MPEVPPENYLVAYPRQLTPGVLTTLIPESRASEFAELQTENIQRVWRVRGKVSDHGPWLARSHRCFSGGLSTCSI